jgi:hypothetical protein
MDFVRHLVTVGYLDESSLQVVQSQRDAPHVGTTLRAVSPSAAPR